MIKISEFSKLSGLSLKALRLYEIQGILVPYRADSNRYRLYTELQLELAKEISSLRATGFSIKEIKALLPFRARSENGFLTILRAQLNKTDQTLETLHVQRNQLKLMIKQLEVGAKSFASDKFLAKRLICKEVSDSIKRLTSKELLLKTKNISNSEYIRTLAMIDDAAKERLLSVISSKARNLVKIDLANFDKKYSKLWAE